MNMYLQELKVLRKSTLIWTIALLAVAALYLCLYPGLMQDVGDFKKLLEGYPSAVREALGLSLDSITSMLGFYSFTFVYIALCGGIQAMIVGCSVLSRETRGRTSDFLLVKPVSRAAVVNAKLLAALTVLLATNILFNIVSYVIALGVKTSDFDAGKVFLINLTLLFVQIIFLAIGLAVSVLIPRFKAVLPASLGTAFGLFFIGALLATKSDSPARYFAPFKYFDYNYIVKNSGYETSYLIAGAAITIVACAITYFVYNKKDIDAVS